MIYILGYKILNYEKKISKDNIELITCRKPFISSSDYSEYDNNEYVLYQLIQDIDFNEKIKPKSKLYLYLVNINTSILEERKRTTNNLNKIARNYACEILCNKLKKIKTPNKQYIRHLCDFKIDYNIMVKNFSPEIPLEYNSPMSLEYAVKSKFIYPYKNLLYLFLNHNDNRKLLPSLPNEIIDLIMKYLESVIHTNFMCIYPESFYNNEVFIMTPAVTMQKNVLKY